MTAAVTFRVVTPAPTARVHVAIRLVLLSALGSIGCSSVYWLSYLVLPALSALRIAQKGGERYLAEDAPRLARAFRWLAGAYAYLWLLTDAPPGDGARGPVELTVEPGGAATPASAMLRLVYDVPAVLLLAALSIFAGLLWVVGAIEVLAAGRVSAFITDFIAATLRYQFRLFAYHLSLVDQYPSFEVAEAPPFTGSSAV